MQQSSSVPNIFIWALVLILGALPLTNSPAQNGSSVFDFRSFFHLVRSEHPIVKQADLQIFRGKAALQGARGNFDPKIDADVNQKYFKGQKYYSLLDGALKIPTAIGVTIENGFEQNLGTQLDPENLTPSSGLWYAGISLPLGRGLLLDERRTILRQARIFQDRTQMDRTIMVNDLLLEAINTYYDWFFADERRRIIENAANLAEERLIAVKASIVGGDRPAMDSLEARIQWQSRLQLLQQAELDLSNSRAKLSVFLWSDGKTPLELQPNAIPQGIDSATNLLPDFIEENVDSLLSSHPKLTSILLKIQSLDLERKWSREQLKPRVDLKYRPITEALNSNPLSALNTENYVWGLSVRSSLFLRKERSKLKLAEIKLNEAEFDYGFQAQEIKLKANLALNNWLGLGTQISQLQEMVEQYRRLLEGERQLFEVGESSLFLINAREASLINSQIKLLDVVIKRKQAKAKIFHAMGILPNPEL